MESLKSRLAPSVANTDHRPIEDADESSLEQRGVLEIREDFRQLTNWLAATSIERDAKPEAISEQLDHLDLASAACLLGDDQLIYAVNHAARVWLAIDDSMLGRRVDLPLRQQNKCLNKLSEQFLTAGVSRLEFVHEARTPQGQWFRWVTIKARTPVSTTDSVGAIVVTRPITTIEEPTGSPLMMLGEQLWRFNQLDEIDQAICQGIALGDSTNEIACSVDLARRSVEVRRSKILEHFSFSRKVQVVRMMVRFEENHLLEP